MRQYMETHPWIRFEIELDPGSPRFWMQLGEARSKCDHIKGIPLEPETANMLMRLFLAKGIQGTTAIEGNSLTENQVLERIEGKDLDLPPSQEYMEREIDNIVEACNALWNDLSRGGDGHLTVAGIKEFNRAVLDRLPPEEDVIPGQIRTKSVSVGNVYRGAPAEDCEYLLERMCEWLNGSTFSSDDPEMKVPLAIIKAALAHLYIAWIHPFGNGNGRTARLVEVQILSAAGIPKPAAHLLSNYYNQARPEYYRQLAHTSRIDKSERAFIAYAVQGFVEGLQSQLHMVRNQQWAVAWENYVHRAFRDDKSPVARRQRKLVLALSKKELPVPKSQLMTLDAEVALGYQGVRTDRALGRDLRLLEQQGLIVREAKNTYRARTETILAFLSPVAPEEEQIDVAALGVPTLDIRELDARETA